MKLELHLDHRIEALGSSTRLFEQLAFKDPGNVIPDGSFESDPYRVQVDGRSAAAWDFTTADLLTRLEAACDEQERTDR